MDWTLTRTTGPTGRPVTLEELKESLRLSQSDTTWDNTLVRLIDAATEQLEQDLDRAILDQVFSLQLDAFPDPGPIQIPNKPVTEVTSVSYLQDGTPVVMDPADYKLSVGDREVYTTTGYWPTADMTKNAVTVEYSCGYAAASNVPRLLKEAIILMASKWFENPSMGENSNMMNDAAYERIVIKLMRSSYP